jgi:uncharacterized protein with HEPN domain
MLDEIDYLLDQRQRVDKEALLADPTLQRAFTRSIEILGEAARQIPVNYRNEYPDVPWKSIAGMRDRLIHGYFAVDYDIVWDVVENKLTVLKDQLTSLLSSD